MLKVGITGQSGFIGTHLYNTLNLLKDEFQTIAFEDSYFAQEEKLDNWVKQCDAIIHLAAMNRHNDPEVIYKTNMDLVGRLINSLKRIKSNPHVVFASSTQEERDNSYGKSKRKGRELLEKWAIQNNAKFTGLVIPNVFGPFGNPYYNSVIATFCHQLTHAEIPKIEVDGELKLIYVGELVSEMIKHLKDDTQQKTYLTYKENYFEEGIIPSLDNTFDRNLFNTFLCYFDHEKFFPFKLKLNTDNRGSFVEIIKQNSGGQVSFSTTVPGITRGNHFHTRKAERFAVIKGKALIQLRRIGTSKVYNFELSGDQPSFVDMPVWFTHNITNIGKDELYTIFWINEHFNTDDPDTYFETV
jgi:UDP-2-acetamido-2,6-beta-L-arabino-hexul-4-ose reductase